MADPLVPLPSAALQPGTDFWHYWASGQLVLQNHSMYSQSNLTSALFALGWNRDDYLIGSPPWSQWIFAAVAMVPFPLMRLIWLIIIALTMVWFSKLVWRVLPYYGLAQPDTGVTRPLIGLLSFSPFFSTWLWGQINFIPVIGLGLFLKYWMVGEVYWAGFVLSLAMIKPHLFAPLLVFLLIRAIRENRVRFMFGFLTGFALQWAVSFALCPASFADFPRELERAATLSLNFNAPTLAQILHSSVLAWAGPYIAIILSVGLALFSRVTLGVGLATSLLFATMFAPYCWSHSFIFLAIPWCATFRGLLEFNKLITLTGCFILGVLQYAFIMTEAPDAYFIWLPWATFVGFGLLVHHGKIPVKASVHSNQPLRVAGP